MLLFNFNITIYFSYFIQEEKNINYIPNLNQQDFSEGNEGTVQPSVYYGYNISSNGNNNQADYSESSSSPAEISDSIVTESKDKAEVVNKNINV